MASAAWPNNQLMPSQVETRSWVEQRITKIRSTTPPSVLRHRWPGSQLRLPTNQVQRGPIFSRTGKVISLFSSADRGPAGRHTRSAQIPHHRPPVAWPTFTPTPPSNNCSPKLDCPRPI